MINTPFLLSQDFFDSFVYNLSVDKEKSFFFLMPKEKNNDKKIISITDDIATIEIIGPLRSKKSFLSFFTQSILYKDILEALHEAESAKGVSKIILKIDSPGGDVDGVEEVANAIKKSKKATIAQVENIAASAAYWIASQADTIVATNKTSRVGSIGVLSQITDWTEYDKKLGVKTYIITSQKSPDKISDVTTEKGRNKIRVILDDLLDVFAARVADGRSTTVDNVFKNFGQGDIVIAQKALERGMIDKIGIIGGEKMSEEFNREEAIQSGVTTERKRVTQLLEWNTNNNVMELVFDAIRSGKTQDEILGSLIKASNVQSEAVHMQAENVPTLKAKSNNNDIDDATKINFLADQALALSTKVMK